MRSDIDDTTSFKIGNPEGNQTIKVKNEPSYCMKIKI